MSDADIVEGDKKNDDLKKGVPQKETAKNSNVSMKAHLPMYPPPGEILTKMTAKDLSQHVNSRFEKERMDTRMIIFSRFASGKRYIEDKLEHPDPLQTL